MTDWHRRVVDQLQAAPLPDTVARDAVRERAADILRPSGALARLDELAVWVAGWQGSDRPAVNHPAAVIFAGDHGVATMSRYPQEVTGAMVEAFDKGKASISAMAEIAGATVTVVDVGVGRPTADIRNEPAMSDERFQSSFDRGREVVADLHTDLLVVGEMGIGNTTAAAAVASVLLPAEAELVVGRGTGVDDDGLRRKIETVAAAVERFRGPMAADPAPPAHSPTDVLETIRHLGGTELAAMAGAIVEARIRSIPVLLDGFVVGASALAVHGLGVDATAHLWAGHRSAEIGHRLVLDHLGLQPLLTLEFRLGEASGAMAAVPLVRMACALVSNVPTMTEWFGS